MWICSHGTGHTDHHQGEPDLFLCHSALGDGAGAIYESGACSFRVAGVRSVLGAVLRQLQSALLVFGKVVLGTISHPLGEKEKRPACRKAAKRFSAGI